MSLRLLFVSAREGTLRMPLDLNLFHHPDFGGEGIAHSWVQKAARLRPATGYWPAQSEFDRFNCLWTAFNAWGMCVTLADTDAAMLRQLKTDQRVRHVFDETMRASQLRDSIGVVEHNFPLPSFSDLLRLDPVYNWRGPRNAAFWQKIAAAPPRKKVRLSPSLDHRNLNWPDTLDCLYKVRCNLVHGGKMANDLEARFVGVFSDLLEALLTGYPNLLDLREG
jgi:hypothetical protein